MYACHTYRLDLLSWASITQWHGAHAGSLHFWWASRVALYRFENYSRLLDVAVVLSRAWHPALIFSFHSIPTFHWKTASFRASTTSFWLSEFLPQSFWAATISQPPMQSLQTIMYWSNSTMICILAHQAAFLMTHFFSDVCNREPIIHNQTKNTISSHVEHDFPTRFVISSPHLLCDDNMSFQGLPAIFTLKSFSPLCTEASLLNYPASCPQLSWLAVLAQFEIHPAQQQAAQSSPRTSYCPALLLAVKLMQLRPPVSTTLIIALSSSLYALQTTARQYHLLCPQFRISLAFQSSHLWSFCWYSGEPAPSQALYCAMFVSLLAYEARSVTFLLLALSHNSQTLQLFLFQHLPSVMQCQPMIKRNECQGVDLLLHLLQLTLEPINPFFASICLMSDWALHVKTFIAIPLPEFARVVYTSCSKRSSSSAIPTTASLFSYSAFISPHFLKPALYFLCIAPELALTRSRFLLHKCH